MSKTLLQQLRQELGDEHVKNGVVERVAYSSDMWPRHQIWKLQGEISRHPPDAVVWPGTVEEIQAVIRLAAQHGVPVIPFGAGSGVCGGAVPLRGGIIMDLKRIDRFIEVNDRDLTVTAEAGILGVHLEDELNDRGYTLGHFPSSILCSSLGGWLAARSAGQFSSRYGKIEDMVVGLNAVLPDGSLMTTGPDQPFDWTQLVVGSEGTLAAITSATLRVAVKPEAAAYRGYRFRNVESAQLAIRQVMQAGLKPHVVRLYDAFDSLLHSSGNSGEGATSLLNPVRYVFGSKKSQNKSSGSSKMAMAFALSNAATLNRLIDLLPVSCLMIIGFEGPSDHVDEDMGLAQRIMDNAGGVDGGEGPGLHWVESRYNVSFKQAKVFDSGAFVDTMEVSCMWSNLMDVYLAVRKAVQSHALIMAHFSHAYREGCSIYFTFAGYKRDPQALERLYDTVWSNALNAAVGAGASASHHHGVGYAKRDIMRREHGAGIRLLYGLKDAWDPEDLMNPGKVLPDRAVKE